MAADHQDSYLIAVRRRATGAWSLRVSGVSCTMRLPLTLSVERKEYGCVPFQSVHQEEEHDV